MITIVIPAKNEEKNIKTVLEQLENNLDLDYDLIVVNDHSEDATKAILQSLTSQYKNLKPIDNLDRPGIANALKTGFTIADGEFIVCLMADLCDDISTIQEMYKKIHEGYDVVCGSRYIKGGRRNGGSRTKAFFSWFVGKTLHYLIKIPTYDIANAFKMYRKEVLKNIEIKSQGFEVSMEISLKAYYKGYRFSEVPTIWNERKVGKSHFKIFKLAPSYFKWYIWAILQELKKCFMH